MNRTSQPVTPDRFDAVLFDLDGVLTATASVHAACWKQMFDAYLRRRAEARQEPFRPFHIETDYYQYVDGKQVVIGELHQHGEGCGCGDKEDDCDCGHDH